MRSGSRVNATVREADGLFRIAVERHGDNYFWETSDCHGVSYSEERAWQRAKQAVNGPCVFCDAHVKGRKR